MNTDPSRSVLPPRDIAEPKGPAKPLARVFVPAVVLMMALVVAVNHRSSGVIGATLAVGVLAMIVAIELPLIFRGQDRRQQALMRSLPDGAFFAGNASLSPVDGHRRMPVDGTVVFSTAGVRFSPRKPANPSLTLRWDEVSSIRLRPQPGKIGVGTLTLGLAAGGSRSFTVPRFAPMARALAAQP